MNLYRGTLKYLCNETSMMGEGHAGTLASQQARVKHFVDSLQSMSASLDDAANVQSELLKETSLLTAEQRKEMSAPLFDRLVRLGR